MNSKILKLSVFILLVTLIEAGCEKENIEPNPAKAILGKWEVIEDTFGPVSYPGGHKEFKPDSVLINYNSSGDTTYSKYWFVDSLLYKSHVYIDQITGDTILVDVQTYKYEFLTSNKLKLVWNVYPPAGAHLQCVPKNSQRRSLNINTFAHPFENDNHLPYKIT